jgi:hypothetical protein
MFQPNSQTNNLDLRTKEPPQPLGTEMVEDHRGLNDKQRPPEVPNNNAAVAPQNQKLSEETMRLHEQISILEQVIWCTLSSKPLSNMIYDRALKILTSTVKLPRSEIMVQVGEHFHRWFSLFKPAI